MSADIHGLVGAYAVDALDDAERFAFERHLAECTECQAEVASLREAAGDLSLIEPVEPPASVRAAVLDGIRSVRPAPPPVPAPAPASTGPLATVSPLPVRRFRPWLAGVAAAAVLLVGGLAWHPWDRAPQSLSATEQVLRAPDAQRIEQQVDGARATIVRSTSLGKAVLIADGMPPAPAGKAFQLWLDMPGKGMVSAGMVPHKPAAIMTVMLEGDAAHATGAGITMEPASGSPAPTTTPLALFTFT